jgi:hypothetical protein
MPAAVSATTMSAAAMPAPAAMTAAAMPAAMAAVLRERCGRRRERRAQGQGQE